MAYEMILGGLKGRCFPFGVETRYVDIHTGNLERYTEVLSHGILRG